MLGHVCARIVLSVVLVNSLRACVQLFYTLLCNFEPTTFDDSPAAAEGDETKMATTTTTSPDETRTVPMPAAVEEVVKETKGVNFIVGAEDDEDLEEAMKITNEGEDSFPIIEKIPSSASLNNMFALAEKRKRLSHNTEPLFENS